jgi:hypothetical protein
MEQMRKTAPTMSTSLIRCLNDMWLYWRSGLEKKKNTTAREIPPNGRLIQKHYTWLVTDGFWGGPTHPSPGGFVGERASEKRPHHAGDAKHRRQSCNVDGAFAQGY